jgi:hypothetical protein
LGFLGRVIHGANPRAWLQEVRERVGEKIDFSAVVGDGLHTENSGINKLLFPVKMRLVKFIRAGE